MSSAPEKFELYKLYLATSERTGDRRATTNQWMLSVNSALVGLYGVLAPGLDEHAVPPHWSWAVPLAGVIVCLAWAGLLAGYRKLNGAKLKVLQEIEEDWPIRPFRQEQIHYKAAGRRRLSTIETVIPWSFLVLYGLMFAFAFID